MIQQGSKAFITDLLHFTAVIGCEHFPHIRIGNRSSFLYICCQADIPAGSTNAQLIAAAFNDPIIFQNAPDREAAIVQRNGYLLFFAGFQGNLCKTLQFLLRAEHTVGLRMDIQLGNFLTINMTGIADSETGGIFTYFQIGVCKVRVAETIAEGILYFPFRRIEITVAHIKALPIFGSCLHSGIIRGRGYILIAHGNRFRQLTAGIRFTDQQLGHGKRTGLTA